ncbi:hypothetical protein D3C72_1698860 [compost metagenome]
METVRVSGNMIWARSAGTGSLIGGPGMICSGAIRVRRSSACTTSAAMPNTVISPKVSKPRKSTRITLTTFWPYASGSARASSSPAMVFGGSVIAL